MAWGKQNKIPFLCFSDGTKRLEQHASVYLVLSCACQMADT